MNCISVSHCSHLYLSLAVIQVGNNHVWGALPLPARSPPEQSYSAPPAYMSVSQMENMMPPPPPDSSKAPGCRSASQRMVNSPIGKIVFILLGYDLLWVKIFGV